ncbi:TonB-dependent receptor [Sphingobium herbicidovorans NBRC 16415]|uniref:TonB-dependent receptor n=1 Tax=Sphingobium herbicidovorans (strain ATCC 700291 / DSM 11019 / CCUG 56400 / KCTC 2939 / LMG 18315 / NBRC 16415 / MH) TaxID=1219045 RepID=A0A086PA85_SPHHM|nr:TonB-dependent receptor [Sphingobium herbicidovorans]KFG90303.1 TonB-dependent receptor [Sphingobium herbicidovorans NBRC 16415]
MGAHIASLGVASLACAMLASQALAQSEPAPNSAVAELAPGDIVVTARRREETAQNVPIALTAIGGATLEARGSFGLQQIQQQLPSMLISVVNPNNTNVNIRGLGANALFSNVGLENGVGVHVDGVYLARPGQSTFELVDLDRIEVLRGPQGTLFGKNTTAGAINIITRAPTFEPEAMVEGTIGSRGTYRGRLSLAGPLSDSVAARVTLSHGEHGAYVRNTISGQGVNESNNDSARAQLLFRPSETFRLRLIADYSSLQDSCCYAVIPDLIDRRVDGTPLPRPFLTRAAQVGYTPLPVDPFARRNDANRRQRINMEQYGFTGEAVLELDGAAITSLTSWRRWRFDPRVDADGIALDIFSRAQQVIDDHQISQELRIASTGERTFDYVVGGYFYDHDVDVNQLTQYGPDAPAFALGAANAINNAALNGFTVRSVSTLRGRSYAAFGQATWHATKALAVTLGLRYNDETKRGVFNQTTSESPDISGLPDAIRVPAQGIRNNFGLTNAYTARTHESNVTGQINVAYNFTPEILAYATYARGSKSGGINLTNVPPGVAPTVGPETVDHFELGVKSSLLDRHLILNGAIFNTTINDYQTTILDPSRSASYLTNGGKVRSRGAELEVRYMPSRAVNLYAAATYVDAEFLSFRNAPCAPEFFGLQTVCDLTGRQIPGAPRWSVSAGGDVTVPLSGRTEGYFGADYSYKSSYNSSSNLSAFTVVDGYALVNARAGLRFMDGAIDVSVFARNLFNKNYFTSLAVAGFNAGQITGFLGEPRIVGVTLRARY